MWSKIVNPKTGRKVNINSKIGKNIIKNYINHQNGGVYSLMDWFNASSQPDLESRRTREVRRTKRTRVRSRRRR